MRPSDISNRNIYSLCGRAMLARTSTESALPAIPSARCKPARILDLGAQHQAELAKMLGLSRSASSGRRGPQRSVAVALTSSDRGGRD